MAHKDYYGILGVDRDASREEIQDVFHDLARRFHPDARPGDPRCEERFKEISAAYEVLGDADQRAQYDRRIGHVRRRRARPTSDRGADPAADPWHLWGQAHRDAARAWDRTGIEIKLSERQIHAVEVATRALAILLLALLAANILIDLFAFFSRQPAAIGWQPRLAGTALVGGLLASGWGLHLRKTTRCPLCHRPWAREDENREVLGVFHRDDPFDGLPAFPHVKCRVYHRCTHCGHRWSTIKTVKLWKNWIL